MKNEQEALQAINAATDQQSNPQLGLLGLAGICQESSSPEPTSGSASGTNRAFHSRLHQDFLEDDNDTSDFNSLMQNHLRAIQEQTESQSEQRTDQDPQSPVSGFKSGNVVAQIQMIPTQCEKESTSSKIDKKDFIEDSDSPNTNLAMSLSNLDKNQNKKAASFAG